MLFRIASRNPVISMGKFQDFLYISQNLKLSMGKLIDSHRFLHLTRKRKFTYPSLLKVMLYQTAGLPGDLRTCGND